MIRRLRVKFVCINMSIVAVMLCVIFATVLHFTQENLEAESLRVLQAVAMNPMGPRRPGELSLPYFIIQTNPWGEPVSASGSYDLSDQDFLLEAAEAALAAREQAGVLDTYGLRFTKTGRDIVFVDISSEVATMRGLVRSCVLIGAGSLLVFLFISLLLSRWAVRPVDAAWRQQRQFVSDASHELKTPLTVILTNAELLQNAGEDAVARSRFTENILTMSRQMRGLIENLLDLARVDNGVVEKLEETIDLSRLAEERLLPFEPVFFEKGLSLESRIEPGLLVQGSPGHLRQEADILLDNARKYAAAGSTVGLRLERSGGRSCLLSVATEGTPLSPAQQRDIFKRFYRVDESRSRDGSYGLGLPIAQGIVDAHKGKIWCESSGGVNTFFVKLPLIKG